MRTLQWLSVAFLLLIVGGCISGTCHEAMPENCLEWCHEYMYRQALELLDEMPALPAVAILQWDNVKHAVVVVQMNDKYVWFVDNGFLVQNYGGRMVWLRSVFDSRVTGWMAR